MIRINETPYRTSNNYGINSIEIDEKILQRKIGKFEGFSIKNDSEIRFLDKNDIKIERKMSQEFFEQTKKQNNFARTFNIEKSTQKPVMLTFDLGAKENSLVEFVNINIKSGVKAQVIVRFVGERNCYHNGVLKVVCDEGSSLDIAVLSDLGVDGENFVTAEFVIKKNASIKPYLIDFSSRHSVYNVYCKLDKESASSKVKAIYLGEKDNVIDFNIFQEVFGQKAFATIDAVGALSGNARKNFKGTISFVKGCKKSFGSEDEFCLLLPDTAKSKALPMLLCGEEDVDGKHSSAVGKADEKELFYIMSRGLSYAEAIKLLVKAKLNVVVNELFDDELKDEILRKVDRRIESENR